MLQTNSLPFFLLCGRSVALCERGTENALSAGRSGLGALAETSSRKLRPRLALENCRSCLTAQVPQLLVLDPLLPL